MSRVVFFSGSGLSADSGLKTFRGRDGYYQGLRAEEVLSAGTLEAEPEAVHCFLDDIRVAVGEAEPNAAHRMIGRVRAAGGTEVDVITQNIDDLLERGGMEDVLHVHGEVRLMRSVSGRGGKIDIGYKRFWQGAPDEAPEGGFRFRHPQTGEALRPDVVLFGEPAPRYADMGEVLQRLGPQDLLVVIGTQGNVVPISRIAGLVPCHLVLVDPAPSAYIDRALFDVVIEAGAAEAADEVEGLAMAILEAESEGRG